MKPFTMLLFMIFSLKGFADSLMIPVIPEKKDSLVQQYSNFQEIMAHPEAFSRTIDYPTQIVRLRGEIIEPGHYCHDVLNEIKAFFTKKITSDKFLYNTLLFCGYDPDTEYATSFTINSYFDPLNDEAIAYLKDYLADHQGQPLLGTIFEVEEALGLAVSLNIDAGKKNNQNDTVMLRYRHDNQSHYFASNYEMANVMIKDIRERFFSPDPNVILPFMKKWFFQGADYIYQDILSRSNYVDLQPERIFFMNKAPRVYTSPLRMYFAHQCSKYENKHCLKNQALDRTKIKKA